MEAPLARRALAELVGTMLLVAVVVGSGIAAQRLSPGDVGLQLFENAAATAAGLVAIILAVGPVSGAHLNPVVSLADRVFGGITTRELGVYVAAQVTGACIGCMLANLMYSIPAVDWSTKTRSGGGLWLAEGIATTGLGHAHPKVISAIQAAAGRAARLTRELLLFSRREPARPIVRVHQVRHPSEAASTLSDFRRCQR